ncbi:MAG: DUF2079 domain-containing protein [Actinomycetota bacterium]|nr:DUF2079 domain-containing protein [Actinomycetota bacterium]
MRSTLLSARTVAGALLRTPRSLKRTAHSLERTGETVVTTVVSLRRRLDIRMLRWQARLDSRAGDRNIPWLTALVLAVVLALLGLARSRDLGIGSDIGHYLQAAHLMDRGFDPVVTDLGHDLFADQAAWVFWPVAWLLRVLPPAGTLIVVQSIVLAVAVVPIWRIARGPANLRIGAASALMAAYALHPSVHDLNLAGFHPEALAIPALMAAYLAARSERWWWAAALCMVVVASRADLGLAVAALGLVLVGEDRRTEGWSIATAGVTWFLVMAFVVQPILGDGDYPHLAAFAAFGDGPLGILFGMLADPFGLLGDVFARDGFDKVLLLLAPVLFLPLIRPRYLLPVLPLVVLYLVADVGDDGFGNPQQDVAALAFVFIAASFALMRIGTEGVSRIHVDRRVLTVLVLTAVVFFVRDAASSPYEEPWDWGHRSPADVARVSASILVGDDARVLVSPEVYPLVADRHDAHVMRTGPADLPGLDWADRIDAVVLDVDSMGWTAPEARMFESRLINMDYRKRFELEGVRLWVRRPNS